MKLSPLLTFFGSSSANFLDFWKDCDLFALQVRDQILRNGLGNRFLKRFKSSYESVREVSVFYKSGGLCESTISSPSYSSINFDAVFDRQANAGANMEKLYVLLEKWIQEILAIFLLQNHKSSYKLSFY